ncbi:quinone oxidoreductase family protein [Sphingobium bisphenolivorans]|uniref:quinone oxidoreductase family protein n=1 Tax=Sphingobium bisphenolivorans TaxID=1335760 RepID=UPI00039CE61F|nr:NADP-dependent oxidoreductase [Sphingobium bisphenolivorans]
MSQKPDPIGTVIARAVTYSGPGGYEVVSLADRAVRPPEPGEVRIRVAAAASSPTDILLRSSNRASRLPPPLTPGMDAAGTVESVGSGVNHLAVGDAVMATVSPMRPEGGAQASFIVIPAASAVRAPTGISFAQAATIPMNGLTALYALEIAARSPGQTLAVTGGAGWLAYLTIVIAKLRGLRVVADAKISDFDLVRGYGADVVVERGQGFTASVRQAVPEGVDMLLDTALLAETSFPAIRDGGIYIPVRGWNGPDAERGIAIKPVMVPDVLERTDWLEELRALVTAGHITPLVAAEFPAERVADAQRLLEAGGVRGRPVILF